MSAPPVSLSGGVWATGTVFIFHRHWNVGTALCRAVWKEQGPGALLPQDFVFSAWFHSTRDKVVCFHPRVSWAVPLATKRKMLKEELES